MVTTLNAHAAYRLQDRRHVAAAKSGFSDSARADVRTDESRAPRCFLVEDSPVIRQALTAALEEIAGVQMIGWCDNEDDAIDWLLAHPQIDCDVLLVDVFLRVGSGLDVIRRARPLRPESRIVVISNFASADIRGRARELGADHVFDKSSELEELLAFFGNVDP